MTTDEIWSKLEELGVSEQTLQIVTDINGYSDDTLYDVLYAYTGYRNFNQMKDDPEYADIVADIDDIEACGDITAATDLTPEGGYLYIFKHGIGPGTIPSDVSIVKVKDLPNYYTAVWLDRFLTADELKQYDIPSETDINYYLDRIGYCQKDGDVVPCDEIEACGSITASSDLNRKDIKFLAKEALNCSTREELSAVISGLDSLGFRELFLHYMELLRDTSVSVSYIACKLSDDLYDMLDDINACKNIAASDDLEEDKIYWVQAYYSKPHRGLADDFATNDWDVAVNKLVEFANQGYYIAFDNLASGDGKYYDPDEVLEAVDFGDIYELRGLANLCEG